MAQTLKKKLRELGSTPQDLAEAIDIPVDYVEDLIAGRRNVQPDLRDDLARIVRQQGP